MGNFCNVCRKDEELKNEETFPEISATQKYISQNLFTQSFEKKLPQFGSYCSYPEYENQLPQNIKNYIKKNPIDFKKDIKNKEIYETPQPIEFKNGNIYCGNWNANSEMDGYGKYFLKDDKVLIEGIWEKGILKLGRIFLPNGDIYEGEIKNSLFNGKGKMIYKDGSIYEGKFINGEKGNYGKITYDDGSYYSGNFKDELPNGYGEFKWNNGYFYKGNFKDGKIEGEGEIKNEKSGSLYKGNFKNNNFHGKGTFKFSSNSIYKGEYYLGKKDGEGSYNKYDGIKFNGNFSNGKLNGTGIVEDENYIYKCTWRNGIVVETPIIEVKNSDSAHTGNLDLNFKVEDEDINMDKLKYLERDLYGNGSDSNYNGNQGFVQVS